MLTNLYGIDPCRDQTTVVYVYIWDIKKRRRKKEKKVMMNEGRSPEFNITSVLSKAWFGVWDTDIIPQPVSSIILCSEMMR